MIGRATFNEAMKYVWSAEGGYSEHPHDTGNYLNGVMVGTNYGITAQTLSSYLGRSVTAAEMRNLSKSKAKDIYYEKYWKPSNAGNLKSGVSIPYFDAVVNTGLGGGAKILQRAINKSGGNVSVDGSVGNVTLDAANDISTNRLRKAFLDEWRQYYLNLNNSHFERGWLNRVDKHKVNYDGLGLSGIGNFSDFDKFDIIIAVIALIALVILIKSIL